MDHPSQFDVPRKEVPRPSMHDRITAHLKPTMEPTMKLTMMQRFTLLTIDHGIVEKALHHFNATCDHDDDRAASHRAIALMLADETVLRILAEAVDRNDEKVFGVYYQSLKDRIAASALHLCTMMAGARGRPALEAAYALAMAQQKEQND